MSYLRIRPMTLCNAVISTFFSVSYLVLEFQTSGTKVSHNCDCPWSQYTYHALNYSFYITHWFQGIQLMASMYSSNSSGWVTPAFSRAICMISCSSGGRAISPRRRLKYWLRPKWQISIVMNLSYCSGYIRFWMFTKPLANLTGCSHSVGSLPACCTSRGWWDSGTYPVLHDGDRPTVWGSYQPSGSRHACTTLLRGIYS